MCSGTWATVRSVTTVKQACLSWSRQKLPEFTFVKFPVVRYNTSALTWIWKRNYVCSRCWWIKLWQNNFLFISMHFQIQVSEILWHFFIRQWAVHYSAITVASTVKMYGHEQRHSTPNYGAPLLFVFFLPFRSIFLQRTDHFQSSGTDRCLFKLHFIVYISPVFLFIPVVLLFIFYSCTVGVEHP